MVAGSFYCLVLLVFATTVNCLPALFESSSEETKAAREKANRLYEKEHQYRVIHGFDHIEGKLHTLHKRELDSNVFVFTKEEYDNFIKSQAFEDAVLAMRNAHLTGKLTRKEQPKQNIFSRWYHSVFGR